MQKNNVKLIAMDLDGTLTQHKSPLSAETRKTLEKLSEKYKLLMVGAGQVERIFKQLGNFEIDIIGNYGLQYGVFDKENSKMKILRDIVIECDKKNIDEKITRIREKYGFTEYKGNNVEFHPSGCVTFPILGTDADLKDKLAFDPDRKKRRKIGLYILLILILLIAAGVFIVMNVFTVENVVVEGNITLLNFIARNTDICITKWFI